MTSTRTEKKRKSDPPAPARQDDPALNLEMLRSMLLQRRFEERCAEAYALGKIGGFCHLYIGQEAVSTGSLSLLRPDDYVITTYRDHGQALARGISARGDGGALRPRDRLRQWQGRLDAHVRQGHQLPRRARHRRRTRSARCRRRI